VPIFNSRPADSVQVSRGCPAKVLMHFFQLQLLILSNFCLRCISDNAVISVALYAFYGTDCKKAKARPLSRHGGVPMNRQHRKTSAPVLTLSVDHAHIQSAAVHILQCNKPT